MLPIGASHCTAYCRTPLSISSTARYRRAKLLSSSALSSRYATSSCLPRKKMSAGGVVHLQKKKVVKLETLAIVVIWAVWSRSRKTAMLKVAIIPMLWLCMWPPASPLHLKQAPSVRLDAVSVSAFARATPHCEPHQPSSVPSQATPDQKTGLAARLSMPSSVDRCRPCSNVCT
jgi:hypothetical protein